MLNFPAEAVGWRKLTEAGRIGLESQEFESGCGHVIFYLSDVYLFHRASSENSAEDLWAFLFVDASKYYTFYNALLKSLIVRETACAS